MNDPPEPTLADVVDSLGPHALQVVTGGPTLEAVVSDPVIIGPEEPLVASDNGVLLLTGTRPGSSAANKVVQQAGILGYCGVVVKSFGEDLSELAKAAEESSVTLLATPDEMSWRHLDGLVTATRSAALIPRADVYDTVGLGDLFALANAIASAVGGAVTIEDPRGQVMAYSNLPQQEIDEVRRQGILGRQTPEYPSTQATYQQVLRAEQPVFVPRPAADVADRLAVAVRAGSQLLGLLWVISDRPPLVVDAEILLADAASATALHLLRARGRKDPERWRRTEALRTLLAGGPTASPVAGQLGIADDAATVVVGIAQTGAGPSEVAVARTIDLVTLYCEFWHPSALCVSDANVVYALLPAETAGGQTHPRLRQLAEDLAMAIRRSAQFEVMIGIGSIAQNLSEIVESRKTADRVLQVLFQRPCNDRSAGTVASVEEVRTDVLFCVLLERGAVAENLLHPVAQAILDHDRSKGTGYAETLLTHFGTFGDIARASESLTIHENTMRYRVRRMQELFGVDFEDADQLLTVWLQLRLQMLVAKD